MKLSDAAALLRSKNASIAYITFDVLFPDRESYEAAKAVLTPERFAAAFGLTPADLIDYIMFDEGYAIKATLPRARIAGGQGLGETDLYGSGQYAPLLEIEIPI